VSIQKGQLTVEQVSLIPSADYAEAWKQRHGRLRTGAWITTAVAVVAASTALVVDRALTEPTFRQEFLPRQMALQGRYLEEPGITGDSKAEATYFDCGANPGRCATESRALSAQLSTQQWVVGAAAGVGVIATGVASYLWLTGADPNRYAQLVASVEVSERGAPGLVLAGRF
jgi:hypothetical protein